MPWKCPFYFSAFCWLPSLRLCRIKLQQEILPERWAAEFTDSFTRRHEDQGVMTVIFACLLIYAILSFVTSVTDVFVEDVSLLHVSSSLCGGRMDKNLLK